MKAAPPDPSPPIQAEKAGGGEEALLARAKRRLLGNYRPAPVVMVEGCGSVVLDTEGRRYLDFCAGIATVSLGHGHPELTRAIGEQAGRLMHVSNYVYNLENIALADELCVATGFDRAFFCNSGAEANEGLLKLARRHFHECGDPIRQRVIAFERSFHGRTMGALSLTGNPLHREGFGALLTGIEHLRYGDLGAVEQAMGPDVAAVLVEPVQGEGGVVPASEGFLAGLRAACDAHGSLLLFDEVQTGIGRTGKLLAGEHAGVDADAIALAKGLGGGFPIGVLLVREHLAGALPPGAHGSTFGGNPLACCAARTVLRVLRQQGLVEAAASLGERLGDGLAQLAAAHPGVCSGSRGLGLLQAVTLVDGVTARDLVVRAREHGLLVTAAGPSALRYTPPLVVKPAEIDEALQRTETMLASVVPPV